MIKPETKLTDREAKVLKVLKILGYEWLARDINGALYGYEEKPKKRSFYWVSDILCSATKKDNELFNFIKWEDIKPTKIDDLLKENNK